MLKTGFKTGKFPLTAFALASTMNVNTAIAQTPAQTPTAPECNEEIYETGVGSVYHDMFEDRKTANGETYTQDALTAAHQTLPFDTIVEVTDTDRDTSVIVRINDRGPFVDNRVIDLTDKARRALGDNNDTPGLHNVQLRLCPQPTPTP